LLRLTLFVEWKSSIVALKESFEKVMSFEKDKSELDPVAVYKK